AFTSNLSPAVLTQATPVSNQPGPVGGVFDNASRTVTISNFTGTNAHSATINTATNRFVTTVPGDGTMTTQISYSGFTGQNLSGAGSGAVLDFFNFNNGVGNTGMDVTAVFDTSGAASAAVLQHLSASASNFQLFFATPGASGGFNPANVTSVS